MTANLIRPSEILDPYPERPTGLGGVRNATQLEQHHRLPDRPTPAATARTSFTASLKPAAPPARRFCHPFTSTALYLAAQLLLTVAIAVGAVNPLTGIAAVGALLACGLTLIAAQATTIRNNRP